MSIELSAVANVIRKQTTQNQIISSNFALLNMLNTKVYLFCHNIIYNVLCVKSSTAKNTVLNAGLVFKI